MIKKNPFLESYFGGVSTNPFKGNYNTSIGEREESIYFWFWGEEERRGMRMPLSLSVVN